MKSVLQQLDSGRTIVADVPVAHAGASNLLVASSASVISAGTERILVHFGRAGLIGKARSQPERVRQVIDKLRSDGIGSTIEAVQSKLQTPLPLGYCNAGVVVEVGSEVAGFAVGDRVVTNGSHAEYVRVPHTLAARIPESVPFESAAFTPVAAIGLQGVRLAQPTLGETVVVYGLGLIGLLTVQILRANGCRVVGLDINPQRLALGARFGAAAVDARSGDTAEQVLAHTNGTGADAVLLTLDSVSNQPVRDAALMCRKRGRIVLVGSTGLNLVRDDFYRKELSFSVSCSYGPGRYDPSYEAAGIDYPLPYVRWTVQRNFEAVLQLMADGNLDPAALVTHRFPIEDALAAYDVVSGAEPSLGIVLMYPERGTQPPAMVNRSIRIKAAPASLENAVSTIGVIGAGNFAARTLLPVLKRTRGLRLHTIVSSGGTSAAIAASRIGFENCGSDVSAVIDAPEIDTVFILTRHDSHAGMAIRALEAGKHVFVEKPLALTEQDLDSVFEAARVSARMVTVGFNRRFAPFTAELAKRMNARTGPATLILTVNAGTVPRDHWTHSQEGGGRIIGEACHFIDLARALVNSAIEDITALAAHDHAGRVIEDIAHLCIAFTDGSTAVVNYMASGSKRYPKERVECFFDGKTVVIDNWRRMRGYGLRVRLGRAWLAQDKGHVSEIQRWLEALRSGTPPIPLDELYEVSLWSIRAASLVAGRHGSPAPQMSP